MAANLGDLLILQRGRCFLCKRPARLPTIEHVIPLSDKQRPRHVLGSAMNRVMACQSCNAAKADRPPTEVELERLMILKRVETGEAETDEWLTI